MNQVYEPVLEHSIEIDAPQAQVWDLVRDVRRMPDWSPQVLSTRLRSGYDEVGLGAQFTSLNRHGEFEWKTRGEIIRFSSEQELAFRIEDNWVVWSFQLEPISAGRTRLTQRRTTPDGISDLSLELTDGFMGGQEAFTQALRDGMQQTLQRIKTAAEQ